MKQRPEQSRTSRLKRVLKSYDFHAFLVTRREDVRYLSGFTGSAGSLLISADRSFLITDFRYKLQARLETRGFAVHIQKTDFFTALRDIANQTGLVKIGFDESAITVEQLKKLKKQGVAFKGCRDIVEPLRKQKDEHELANIRLAVKRAEQSFRELKKYIKSGITEREIGLKLDYIMREHGSRKPAFDTIVASARNGAMPHASTTNRRLKTGDLVTIDFGAEANGYFSDITRTFCLGKPSARQQEIHALVLHAQASAIKSIRPGVTCKCIDDGARDLIKKAGYGKYFGHGTGHGVGLMVHEEPTISFRSHDRVIQNMVFTVEPGVYIPGWGGVRIEDMVLVTDTGMNVLTTLPRELDGLARL